MRHWVAKSVLVFVLCFFAVPVLAASNSISGRLSGNWSGYVAAHADVSGVGASWVVPSLALTSTLMSDVTWVGIGGTKSKDLIQAGTHSVVQNGHVQYWAWYELLPEYQQVVPLVVRAGDNMSVLVTLIAPDLWLVSIANLTSGATFSKTLEYSSRHSSVEWIEEMPTVYDKEGSQLYAPLSEFDKVTFSDAFAVIDGKSESIENTRARATTMVSKFNKKIALVTPSELLDSGFSVTRTTAIASPATLTKKRAKAWEIVWSKQ